MLSNRPAETGGVTSSLAVLIAYALGIKNPGILAALTVVVGFIPAAITWIVVTIRKKPGGGTAGNP